MSGALPPQKVLAQLEEQKSDELTRRLTALTKQRTALVREMEDAEERLAELRKAKGLISQETTTALELSALEAERQREQGRKGRLAQALEVLRVQENEFRVAILASMSKSKAYTKLLENEKRQQQKHAERAEQQSIDDLLAYRRIKGE